jgi:hypothetical protein
VKASLSVREKRSKSSIAISMAIHVVVFAALATITFHYPLADIFHKPESLKPIPVRYIPLKPRSEPAPAPRRAGSRATPPVQLPQVSSIPATIPAPVPVPVSPSTTALGGGAATGQTSAAPGIGLGIRPGIPDGRLATNPIGIPRAPETEGQLAERALAAIYSQYLDSARAQMGRDSMTRKAGDWSWGGKDGDKWGWDQNGIHVAGITIPNIVLAALPMNVSPSMSPVDMRSRDVIRNDIQSHAGLMTEDEFKAAVRRVRERVDRERRERMEKQKEREKKTPPCCS